MRVTCKGGVEDGKVIDVSEPVQWKDVRNRKINYLFAQIPDWQNFRRQHSLTDSEWSGFVSDARDYFNIFEPSRAQSIWFELQLM